MKTKKKSKKRLIGVDEFCRLNVITSTVISPDEKTAAYTVETISEDKRKYFSHIYTVDLATGKSQRYTFGEVSDRGLVWSPDGRTIAFISTRKGKSGIYLIPSGGGGERLVLEGDGSFSNLIWTPACEELIYQFRRNDSYYEKDEKKKKEAPLYRHITRLLHRLDGEGFLPQDRFHIWKLDIAAGKARQLTKGKYDELDPDLSPDGKQIVYVSNRSKDPDFDFLKDDLYIIPSKGGKAKKVPTPVGPVMMPSFSPDGKKIAYLGHADPNDAWGVVNMHLWTVGAGGRPGAKNLISKFDRSAYDATIGDIGEGFASVRPVWSSDSKRIYFSASDTGKTHIFYVSAWGGLPTRITHKNCHIKDFSLNGRKKKIIALVAGLKSPGELYLMPPVYHGDDRSELLTGSNKKLFSGISFPGVREVWFKAYDGTELQGWLATPPGLNKNRKYPGILEIHGGPRTQYGFTFFHEMLYLASKGYVVFYTNPRGGAGRGETFAGTIVADWGGIDYLDCMAATDYLENLPFVNKKRIGVTGGSYGGYMTNWMIGHTNRFEAAVTQRSVVDLRSFVGSSDVGYDLYREFDGFPWTNAEVYERCSPLAYAKNIKTPLLIIHSERDLRCGIEQAEQLFATLKLMKKKVEMVRFPEEPHGLSRHGRPDRRIARLQWIVKWFNRYLLRK